MASLGINELMIRDPGYIVLAMQLDGGIFKKNIEPFHIKFPGMASAFLIAVPFSKPIKFNNTHTFVRKSISKIETYTDKSMIKKIPVECVQLLTHRPSTEILQSTEHNITNCSIRPLNRDLVRQRRNESDVDIVGVLKMESMDILFENQWNIFHMQYLSSLLICLEVLLFILSLHIKSQIHTSHEISLSFHVQNLMFKSDADLISKSSNCNPYVYRIQFVCSEQWVTYSIGHMRKHSFF